MTLVTFDTDSIKSYVFATSKLKEIRGASTLLDYLNDTRIPRLVGLNRMVYAGGGTALAKVDDARQAEQLIQQVEQMYRLETKAAEVTGAYIEMPDPDVKFGEYVRRLNFQLRLQKEAKLRQRSWLTSPLLKACKSCGQYPASRLAKAEDAFICNACHIKRMWNQKIRDQERDSKTLNANSPSRLVQLLAYAYGENKWPHITLDNAPEDFNEIGEFASPKGYIGFIYCDGNRMGNLISLLETSEAFKKFSEEIRITLKNMTFDTLLEYFPEENLTDTLPFEIIFLGGDDLMLVVAADKAIEIAISLCQEFEKRTKPILEESGVSKQREYLSLSTAVVFAHASLPIYHLQSIVDDLLKSAKRHSQSFFEERGQEDRGQEISCIDFHVVTASASEAPLPMRKKEPASGKGELWVSERPYTAEGLQLLVERIRALKKTGFPTSKLQMLYEAIVGQSMTQAMFTWAFVAGRAKRSDDPEKNQMQRLFEFFSQTTGRSFWPWRESAPGKLSTPFLDVAELYDFIK